MFFKSKLALACLIFCIGIVACTPDSKSNQKKETIVAPGNESTPQYSSTKWQTGEIYDARGLDGCQFLIKTESGQQLQPINLESNYQKNGLKIEFQAEPVTDMMSICMAGPMVRILKIQEKK